MEKKVFISIFILFSAFATTLRAQSYTSELYIDTPEKFAQEFFNNYSDSNLPDLNDADYLGQQFAWSLYNWLMVYIRMHQMTDDIAWLDRADESIRYMLDHTDDKKYERGDLSFSQYLQAPGFIHLLPDFQPHIGWSRYFNDGVTAEVLIDGNICKHIMLVVDYMLSNGFDQYDTDSYISVCSSIIKSHDTSFILDRYPELATIDGIYYYPSRDDYGIFYPSPVGFNHNNIVGETAILLYKYSGDSAMLEKAQIIRNTMLRHMTEVDDHYIWSYSINKNGVLTQTEDVNHGSYDAHFLYTMWKEGQLSDEVMTRLANTVPYFLTESSCANNIAGGGADDGGDWTSVSYGYLDIAFAMKRDDIVETILKSVSYYFRDDLNLWNVRWRSIADVLAIDMLRLRDTVAIPIIGVSVSPALLKLDVGQTSDLTETISPFNATDRGVTWASSNGLVARVSSFGLVSAMSAGSATITATTDDGNFTAPCSVTVNPAIDFEGYEVSASSFDAENVPLNTRDGISGSRWSASGDREWIEFDMQETRRVDNLEIAFYMDEVAFFNGFRRTTNIDIQISTDHTNWTVLFSGSSSGTTLDLETIDFTDTNGRYLRIIGHGNSDDDWNSLTEIKINLGADVSACSQTFDDEEIKLYPNPTVDLSFNIDLSEYSIQDEFNVSILDVAGKVIYKDTVRGGHLHQINALQVAGLYLVKAQSKVACFSEKLIVR